MSRSEEVIPKLEKHKLSSLISKGERIDGRELNEYRPITIDVNCIEKAEGSAIVSLGNTVSIAGVKAEIGTPFADTPNEGVLIVNAEFLPLASPSFEPGPPDENAIEIARVVDRGIRSSRTLDLERLCIIPGKRVWVIYVDVYVLNHNGNMIDASGLAVLSALLTAKIPVVKVSEDERIGITDEWVPLPIRDRPIPVTMAKIGDKLVVDPNINEELSMDCRLTLTVNERGSICAVQKGGRGSLSMNDILYAVDLALKVSKEIRSALPPLPKIEDITYVVK